MITSDISGIRSALAAGDMLAACKILDTLAADVLAANYSDEPGWRYDTSVYDAASTVYVIGLETFFGLADMADDFRRVSELGESHAYMMVSHFSSMAGDARYAAELISAMNDDHAAGYHEPAGDRHYAENTDYRVREGCRSCVAPSAAELSAERVRNYGPEHA